MGNILVSTGASGTTVFQNPGLRLTLTSGTAVTTSDVTGAGNLYWTPDNSGNVWYWDGSAWQVETITEQSLSLTLTSGKNYDVFYLHGTGLVLSSAWTNDTTRADALGTQNGVTVLASDHTKLWIGTIRASGTNTTEDSKVKRFVWNKYNQIGRLLAKSSTTSHTYGSTTAQSWNADATNQVELIVGEIQTENINLFFDSTVTSTVIGAVYAVIDWTSSYGAADDAQAAYGNNRLSSGLSAVKQFTLGYHYVRAVEAAFNGTATFDQFAITSKFQM